MKGNLKIKFSEHSDDHIVSKHLLYISNEVKTLVLQKNGCDSNERIDQN